MFRRDVAVDRPHPIDRQPGRVVARGHGDDIVVERLNLARSSGSGAQGFDDLELAVVDKALVRGPAQDQRLGGAAVGIQPDEQAFDLVSARIVVMVDLTRVGGFLHDDVHRVVSRFVAGNVEGWP